MTAVLPSMLADYAFLYLSEELLQFLNAVQYQNKYFQLSFALDSAVSETTFSRGIVKAKRAPLKQTFVFFTVQNNL